MEQLDASSRVLPCQHTFCKRCLDGIVETHKELRCPECRIVVGTDVCDLPTNILLIRLLDGLKRNPKFVPRHVRQRSHSRPAFRIDRQIFFQSAAPVAPLPAPVSQNRRVASSRRTCTEFRTSTSACPQFAGEVPCSKPMACRVQPQRRSDTHSSTLPPRVVPDQALVTSCRTANRTMGRVEQVPSSSSTRCVRSRGQDFSPNAFGRSSSHDFLAGMQVMYGQQLPINLSTTSSARTKSLSRPSSRVSDKHASLPNRISISPSSQWNQMESRPTTLALNNKLYTERPKSQSSAPSIIGNPLYGYMARPAGEQAVIRKSEPLLMSQSYASVVQDSGSSGRRVQALYGCVGETMNELSFEPDAIITEGE